MKDAKVITVPPPQMVANMRVGNRDGYCVGEPWGHRAIADGIGITAMTTQDIWKDHPEKVLGTSVGIGFWVWDEWNSLNVPHIIIIIIAIVTIGVVGLLLEQALVRLHIQKCARRSFLQLQCWDAVDFCDLLLRSSASALEGRHLRSGCSFPTATALHH